MLSQNSVPKFNNEHKSEVEKLKKNEIINKETNITVRVSNDLKLLIEQAARNKAMKPSEYVRYLIYKDLEG